MVYFCKCRVEIEENKARIYPRKEDNYKPVIDIKDIIGLEKALLNFNKCLIEFYTKYEKLKEYQNLSYFLI